MGCFNVSCAVSHITINEGERAFLFPLLPNISNYEIKRGHPDDGSVIISPCSMFLETTELYNPFCFPIEGIYNDYGSLENIVENENTKAIEEFLGISIQEFVELVTENRGKNAYDSVSRYYENFFVRKDLMEDNVSFKDFLIGLGFEQLGTIYRYPGSNYSVSIEHTGNEEEYILIPDTEAESRMRKYFFIADDQWKLPSGYRTKNELLELHQFMTGETIGAKECDAFGIVRKLSAMFVHGAVYDELAKPEYVFGEKPEELYVPSYLIQKLGFIKDGSVYVKENMQIIHDDYTTLITKNDVTIRTNNCREFVKAYETLSGEKCDFTDLFGCDNKTFLFKDLQLDYQRQKSFFESIRHKVNGGKDIDWSYWLKGIDGLMTFRDWNYFIPIYLKKIEDGSIESEYVRYMRFFSKMYQINGMFMPTYQGVQGGNSKLEKELLETALRVVDEKRKLEEEEEDEDEL